jgi:type II secretory pathway predicted ATPase ExeA
MSLAVPNQKNEWLLRRSFDALHSSATALGSRRLVLIIDDADALHAAQPELLRRLQTYAKEQADRGRVTVVFAASSEGEACAALEGARSAITA